MVVDVGCGLLLLLVIGGPAGQVSEAKVSFPAKNLLAYLGGQWYGTPGRKQRSFVSYELNISKSFFNHTKNNEV